MMVQALTDYKSNLGLCLGLRHLIAVAKKNSLITLGGTVKSFEQDIDSGANEYATLLHTIPTGLRDSLIQGTLAYDYVKGKDVHGKELEERGKFPGIYAVGIAIEGRDGAFINLDECNKVADILENYASAYEHLSAAQHEHSPLPADAQQVIDAAFDLDLACGYARGPMLHYLDEFGQVANKEHLKQLAKCFRRRHRALQTLGCDATVNMHQSPLYVGCTTRPMAERLAQHHYESIMATVPSTSNLFLSLTLGALRYIGLNPYTVEVPIMPIWVKAHLPMGERLVTLLASSLVTQAGLNGVEAGSRAGTGMDLQLCDEAESYVAEKTKYFEENLDHTNLDLDDFERRTEGFENLKGAFQRLMSGEMLNRVEDTIAKIEQLEVQAKAALQMKDVIQENLRKKKRRQERLAAQYAFNTGFNQLLRSITTRMGLEKDNTYGRTGGPPPE